jgi:RNA polymerase sigma factor (sigma-70 family)
MRLLRANPFGRIRDSDQFRAYTWTIADNVAKTHLHKRRKERQRREQMAPTTSSDGTGESGFEIASAIQSVLSSSDEKLLRLLLDGTNLQEISLHLGVSYAAAGVRLYRLRKKIRNSLKNNDK